MNHASSITMKSEPRTSITITAITQWDKHSGLECPLEEEKSSNANLF
jgi:hypothetical protein